MKESTILLLLFSLPLFHKIHTTELETISGSRLLTDRDTLVSQTGTFEVGFFRPGSSDNRYLGIWYKKVSVRTVVWVANRDHPLVGALPAALKVADPGILVLLNNNSLIWSSNITMASRNLTAKLHDSGNLVLMDLNEKVMWQSFDYPTDTLLPGMKLGRNLLTGMEWHLTSWKSSRDPALGELTWGADVRGYPENKLKQGEAVKFRGGAWSNQRYTGISQFNRSLTFVYNVVIIKSEVSFSYNLENSSIISRVALNSSGQLESSVWVEEAKKWQLSLTLPRDICDTYNICGAYGICSVNTVTQSCACLDEKRFVPRNEKGWNTADRSGGCVRKTPLDCRNGSEGFIKYSNVKLPDTVSTWFNMSTTLKQCEEICLKNCTCMAYANPDPSLKDKGCVLWFDHLLDIRVYPEGYGGQDIFVRMASSEIVAQSAYKKKGRITIKIMLLVLVPGFFLIGFICIWFLYVRRKRNRLVLMRRGESLHVTANHDDDIQLPSFSFSSMATATDSFSTDNILGEGGFGTVYKGVLEDGTEIAVKRLSKTSSQGVDEFKNEVICVSKLQHRNLVKLLGCCIQGNEKLLVYEYMPNRSLDSFIFDENHNMFLDWTKRFNIIQGIARGLVYLHHDSRIRIIHRDLKASNILLLDWTCMESLH